MRDPDALGSDHSDLFWGAFVARVRCGSCHGALSRGRSDAELELRSIARAVDREARWEAPTTRAWHLRGAPRVAIAAICTVCQNMGRQPHEAVEWEDPDRLDSPIHYHSLGSLDRVPVEDPPLDDLASHQGRLAQCRYCFCTAPDPCTSGCVLVAWDRCSRCVLEEGPDDLLQLAQGLHAVPDALVATLARLLEEVHALAPDGTSPLRVARFALSNVRDLAPDTFARGGPELLSLAAGLAHLWARMDDMRGRVHAEREAIRTAVWEIGTCSPDVIAAEALAAIGGRIVAGELCPGPRGRRC